MAYEDSSHRAEVRNWLDTGLASHRQGDFVRAIECYQQALGREPGNADALNLLGTALLQTGDSAQATDYLERAANRQRNNPRILANLAQCYIALGRLDDACRTFRKASRIEPKEVQFHLGVATTLAMQGNTSDAETLLTRLTTRFPTSPLVWLNLGNVMRNQGHRQEAIDHFTRAVELAPELTEARNSLGSALHSKLRFAEAEAQYRACLRLDRNHALARYNLASVLMDLGRFKEAEAVARELVAQFPHAPESHTLLGAALGMQSRLLEAHAAYEQSARLALDSVKAMETMAMSFIETGRMPQGLRYFSRALNHPDLSNTRPLIASALLADGALQDGWTEYRSRHDATVFMQKHPDVPITQAPLGDVQRKHICVLREQGLGDELFFLRYAAPLGARGARITYRASNKIASLLARVSCIAQVIGENDPLPAADAYVLAGDLPHVTADCASSALPTLPVRDSALGDHERRISVYWPHVPASLSLQPLEEKRAEMQARLSVLGPPPYMALTWRAGTQPEAQRASNWLLFKTIALETLADTLKNFRGTLLAVQRAPLPGELARLEAAAGNPVHDFCALNDDLEGMLALLDVVDDYVGVSNTNMHLRVALGKTARVLVPAPAEWRWMRSGCESRWFPGFVIYRQSLQGDWSVALATLKRDLEGTFIPSDSSFTA
ncbi:MAG: tetratricopeptide repeat protein [Pseudomonadota bacterium]